MKQEERIKIAIEGFSNAMKEVMMQNTWKKCWWKESFNGLKNGLNKETWELRVEISKGNTTKEKVVKECVDVANFCMMIADKILDGNWQNHKEA